MSTALSSKSSVLVRFLNLHLGAVIIDTIRATCLSISPSIISLSQGIGLQIMIHLELTSSFRPLPPLRVTASLHNSVVGWATAIIWAPNSFIVYRIRKILLASQNVLPSPTISHLNPLHPIVPSVFDIDCNTGPSKKMVGT